jgi:hypothetical protein
MSDDQKAVASSTAARDFSRALHLVVDGLCQKGDLDPVALRLNAAEISPESLRLAIWQQLYSAVAARDQGEIKGLVAKLRDAIKAMDERREVPSDLISDNQTARLLDQERPLEGATALTLGR